MLFQNVAGYSAIKHNLIRSIHEGRISHTQLFSGPEGGGALPLAMAYIQYLFCSQRTDDDSCGECLNCKRIAKLNHPDLHLVYPISLSKDVLKSSDMDSSQWKEAFLLNPYLSVGDWNDYIHFENKFLIIGREESRDIIHQLNLTSFEGSFKVLLIWMAERMNDRASNALLKILEEPLGKTVILLVCEQPSLLPVTILSRAQHIKIPILSDKEIAEALVKQSGVTKEAASAIAKLSGGNYRLAKIMAKDSKDVLFYTQKFIYWMRACARIDGIALTKIINEIASLGREKQKQFFQFALQTIRQGLLTNVGISPDVASSEKDFINRFSSFITLDKGEIIEKELTKLYHALERNANPKIMLMDLSLNLNSMFN